MPLDPQAAVFVDRARASGTPQMGELNIEDMRAAARAVIPHGYDFEDVSQVRDVPIPVNGTTVTARVYTPEAAGTMPVVLWLHGGSFSRCGFHTHDTLWRRFANRSGSVVVGLDFRLAPEHRYPIPLEDAYAAAIWTAARAEHLGNGMLTVAGESSGGALAASLALLARQRGGPGIESLLLIEPMLDRDSGLPSRAELAQDYLLTDAQIHWAYDQYAPEADRDDPLVYPFRAHDVTGLPRSLVVTVEYDPLRDEGERFVERLQSSGVPATCSRVPGLIHPALLLPKVIERGADVLDEAVRLFREAHSRMLQPGS